MGNDCQNTNPSAPRETANIGLMNSLPSTWTAGTTFNLNSSTMGTCLTNMVL